MQVTVVRVTFFVDCKQVCNHTSKEVLRGNKYYSAAFDITLASITAS